MARKQKQKTTSDFAELVPAKNKPHAIKERNITIGFA